MGHSGEQQTTEMIGRYFPQWKFEKLLQDKAIYFSSLRLFTDQYEGFVDEEYFNQLKSGISLHWHGNMDEGERNTIRTVENAIRHIKDCTFVSCWTNRINPSADLWSEYLGDKFGVLVLVNKEALIEQIQIGSQERGLNLQSRNVTYFDQSETSYRPKTTWPSENPLYEAFAGRFMHPPDVLTVMETGDFLFHKIRKFEFEQEYRIVASFDYGIDFGGWRSFCEGIGTEYGTMAALNHLRIDSEEEYERTMATPTPSGKSLNVKLEDVVSKIILKPGVIDEYIKKAYQLIEQNGLESLNSKLSVCNPT